MAYLHDDYRSRGIVNLVDDPVWSLTNSVAVVARELLTAWRPRIVGERGHSIHDEPTIFLGRRVFNLSGGGAFELEAISMRSSLICAGVSSSS